MLMFVYLFNFIVVIQAYVIVVTFYFSFLPRLAIGYFVGMD